MTSDDVKRIKDQFGRKISLSEEIHRIYFVWSIPKLLLFIVLSGMIYLLCLVVQYLPMAGPALALFGGVKGAQLLLDRIRDESFQKKEAGLDDGSEKKLP